jgi:hypothetical protein
MRPSKRVTNGTACPLNWVSPGQNPDGRSSFGAMTTFPEGKKEMAEKKRLVRQLDGKMEIDRKAGTAFRITF